MLKTYLKNNNISIYKLSKKTGIPYSSLNDFVNKKGNYRNFSFYFYEEIAKALNLNLLQLAVLVKNDVFVDKNSEEFIREWWNNRKILDKQSGIKNMLLKNNVEMTANYLVKNLGLSLNDYYWIRPIDLIVKWEDVNFFDNNFTKVYLQPDDYNPPENVIEDYVPNATLKGQLEKTWLISNNSRLLLKGNSRHLSAECQNEVFASLLHEKQNI